MEICGICNKKTKSLLGLASHVSQKHKNIKLKEYYDKFIENDNKCSVCGNKKTFNNLVKGYKKFCDECLLKRKSR